MHTGRFVYLSIHLSMCVCVFIYPLNSKLCDEQVLSFNRSGGYRLQSGLQHQKFFFENGIIHLHYSRRHSNIILFYCIVPPYPSENITMVQPHVQFLSDNTAYVCYIRLSQFVDKYELIKCIRNIIY